MHDQQAQKQKKIECALAPKVFLTECPNKQCLWYSPKARANCSYKEKADENDKALHLGLSLEEAALETRRAKGNIQKILVLDKYVEFVREKGKWKNERLKDLLNQDAFILSLRDKGLVWDELFHMSVPLFVELCRKKNYKDFVKENKSVVSYKLSSLLGLRESMIEKVNSRYNSLVRKKRPLAVVIKSNQKGKQK